MTRHYYECSPCGLTTSNLKDFKQHKNSDKCTTPFDPSEKKPVASRTKHQEESKIDRLIEVNATLVSLVAKLE